MSTNCAPLIATLCNLFYYAMKDFMASLLHHEEAEIIQAFDTTSKYLDDLLHIDNSYFEGIVSRIFPLKLQLNKANASDTEPYFLIYIYLFQTDFFHPKFTISEMTLILT